MKITKRFIESLDPCDDGYEFWLKAKKPDLADFMLHALNENHFKWAIWLFVRSVEKITNVKLALFSAEQMLHIFEEKYPKDNRPRLAIQATKDYISNPCEETVKLYSDAFDEAVEPFIANDTDDTARAVAYYVLCVVAYAIGSEDTYVRADLLSTCSNIANATIAPDIIYYAISLLKESENEKENRQTNNRCAR